MNILIKTLLTLSFLFTISCSKNNDIPNTEERDKDQLTTYNTQSISYDIQSVSIEEVLDRRPSLTYHNNTSVNQKVIINPENLLERSLFTPDRNTSYTILDSTKLISLPLQINSGEITFGDKKWVYSEYQNEKESTLLLLDSVTINPGTGFNTSLTVVYQKITMPYILVLKETSTQDTVHVTGKWTGTYPVNMRTSFNFYEL